VYDSQNSSPESVDSSEEVTDTEDNEEEDLGVLDDQRSIILHLLSQLKLGMDLTRVLHTHTHTLAVPPKLIIKLMMLKELYVYIILPFLIQTGTTQDCLSVLNLREQRRGFPAFYDLEILTKTHTVCHKHGYLECFGIHNEFI